MGIPYAFYYYYNKYNCENELMIELNKLNKININHLFLDYNSLIHPCAQQILSINHDKYMNILDIKERTDIIEIDIINNCLLYTRYIINQVINIGLQKKHVYITIDGVAPRSKMNQQRERRYKSEFFKSESSNEKSCLWDSNKITPGTCFMNKLKDELEKFSYSLKDELCIDCNVSDSSENGEGEHKIMTMINNLKSDDRICIYGLDADLIMLSLMNKRCNEIILIRDNSFNNKLSDDKKVIDYLNIKSLRNHIYNDMLNSLKEYNRDKSIINNINIESIIYDYIVICFFLGNDFLDHLPSLSIKKNGIDTIMKAYSYSWKGKHLINKQDINTNNWKESLNLMYLKDIMYQLKNHETYFFKNFKLENLALSENQLLSELEESSNVQFYKDNIIFDTDSYKKRYYTFYNISNINETCLNYIEGLYWIFGYYNNHIHKNWTWYYKYHNTPFCSDIFEFLRKFDTFNTIQPYIYKSDNLNPSNTFSSLKQLYMVLPKTSLENILKELNETDNTSYLFKFTKFYPDKLCADIINKRYLWQTKIFFDNIDDNIIDMFI